MCSPRAVPVILLLAALLGLFTRSVASNKFSDITGRRAPCSNEGERVLLDGEGMSCFPCVCKNGFVDCKEPVCPPVEDCYMLMPRTGCCSRCKGCWYNGTEHASHTEWSADARLLRCEAGVLTVTRPECYAPCAHPARTRHTHYDCPVCNDCTINGQHVGEGREVTIPEDPCLKCRCAKGGLTCAKRACAVLACPEHAQHTPLGECCPRCTHATAAKILPGHTSRKPCIMGKDYHPHLSTFSVDNCTACQCVNGTAVCERKTCPVVTCGARKLLRPAPGKCCPRCPVVEEVKTGCAVGGKSYQDGETWQWDDCKSCECHAGEWRCAMERCPVLECAPDQQARRVPGQCCPACVHTDGVCTVFGDPHYKTFDGKFYSFQGSCKYQLVADCTDDTFSIRISNDARNTSHSSWTRTVALRMGGTKINLGRRMRVKVDGERVQLPYSLSDGRAHVSRDNGSVTVNTTLGVNMLWDGEGFLEVTVSSVYRNKLCGLCGNFNSLARDDLTTRDGRQVMDFWRFGTSWRVGGRKACSRKRDKPVNARCGGRVGHLARRLCRGFEKSDVFSGCVAKLNPTNYRKACVRDACGCEARGQCHCASFRAYARECRRLGAEPGESWTRATWCEGASPPWLRGPADGDGGGDERGGGPEEADVSQEQQLLMSAPVLGARARPSLPQHSQRPRPPPPLNLQ